MNESFRAGRAAVVIAVLMMPLGPTLPASAAAPPAAAAPAAPPAPPGGAVLVGANVAPPGRRPLLYGHRDAERMAEVLSTVGRMDPGAVRVLRDPAPEEVIAALESQSARLAGQPNAVVYFYYSGHADEAALYPGGRPLPLERVRRILDATPVAVKVGMVDACRGGSWTRAKGLSPEPPFQPSWPVSLTSEGSVLIASSSGQESAHESDHLQASFFTYHFAAALSGAADRSGDGEVTLTEAFEYAKERTIRDSLRQAREPQHPSYALNLRGRHDLVLSRVSASATTLLVAQADGPLELIHAATGVQLLELPPGRRRVRVAVPPGRYLVRKAGLRGFLLKDVTVATGSHNVVDEADLTLVATSRLAVKGDDLAEPLMRAATPGRGRIASHLIAGPTVNMYQWWADSEVAPELQLNARWGITDRLTWRIGTLGFAYRLGETRRWDVIPVAGAIAYQSRYPWRTRAAAGAAGRVWLSAAHALVAHAHFESEIPLEDRAANRRTYWTRGSIGYQLAAGDRLTLSLAVGGRASVQPGEALARERVIAFGSVQEVGLRRLPLFEMHVSPRFSVELHAAAEYHDRVSDGLTLVGPGDPSASRTTVQRWSFPIHLGLGYVF